jgi:hypothetical protein
VDPLFVDAIGDTVNNSLTHFAFSEWSLLNETALSDGNMHSTITTDFDTLMEFGAPILLSEDDTTLTLQFSVKVNWTEKTLFISDEGSLQYDRERINTLKFVLVAAKETRFGATFSTAIGAGRVAFGTPHLPEYHYDIATGIATVTMEFFAYAINVHTTTGGLVAYNVSVDTASYDGNVASVEISSMAKAWSTDTLPVYTLTATATVTMTIPCSVSSTDTFSLKLRLAAINGVGTYVILSMPFTFTDAVIESGLCRGSAEDVAIVGAQSTYENVDLTLGDNSFWMGSDVFVKTTWRGVSTASIISSVQLTSITLDGELVRMGATTNGGTSYTAQIYADGLNVEPDLDMYVLAHYSDFELVTSTECTGATSCFKFSLISPLIDAPTVLTENTIGITVNAIITYSTGHVATRTAAVYSGEITNLLTVLPAANETDSEAGTNNATANLHSSDASSSHAHLFLYTTTAAAISVLLSFFW